MEYIEERPITQDELENPCKYCEKEPTCDLTCFEWKQSFLRRWSKIHAYGKKVLPDYYKRIGKGDGQ